MHQYGDGQCLTKTIGDILPVTCLLFVRKPSFIGVNRVMLHLGSWKDYENYFKNGGVKYLHCKQT